MMTDDLKAVLESGLRTRLSINKYLPKQYYKQTFSPRKEIACLGYDKAKEMGLLEVYKDARGANFNRYVDFNKKYPELCDIDVDSE